MVAEPCTMFPIFLMIMKVKGGLTTLLSGSAWEQLTVGLKDNGKVKITWNMKNIYLNASIMLDTSPTVTCKPVGIHAQWQSMSHLFDQRIDLLSGYEHRSWCAPDNTWFSQCFPAIIHVFIGTTELFHSGWRRKTTVSVVWKSKYDMYLCLADRISSSTVN